MIRRLIASVIFCVALNPHILFASATVSGLQMPAWLERNGQRQPLRLGQELRSGDVIFTGNGSRALLRLDEGSAVKLGEQAQFSIDQMAVDDDPWGSFHGVFDVFKGAFRFTTAQISKLRKREIDIRVGTTTAGIRGTDLWGRSNQEADLVCLIEGMVQVSNQGDSKTLDQPLSFYRVPKGAAPLGVATVDPKQLAEWAEETELQADQGVMNHDGHWRLQLGSFQHQTDAAQLIAKLGDEGFAAKQESVEVDSRLWHRVIIHGFVTAQDATAASHQLKNKLKLVAPWISKASQ